MKTKPSPTPYALVAVDIPAYVIGGPRDRANGFVCGKTPTFEGASTKQQLASAGSRRARTR